MQTLASKRGDVVVFALGGNLDVETSPDAQAQFVAAIQAGERKLLFDLAKLEYVSSAGLRAFVVVLKEMKVLNGKLAFCCLSDPVKKIFDIAGMSFRVDIYPTVEKALEQLQAGS